MNKNDDYQYTKHEEKAMELFKSGCNCAQAVLGAFADETNIDIDLSMKISSSFGVGMGKLREVCGTVISMSIIAGIKYGYSDIKDKGTKDNHDKLIQSLAEKFKDQTGSIVCRELLKEKRPCVELVGLAARIIDENLMK